jgi:AcrR family transcriptional regulator
VKTGRSDGLETKTKILNVAGEIFAQRGYHNTASKDICLAAKVNSAAINYHFDGKDGLYGEILQTAIQHFLNMDFLCELERSSASADDKLNTLLNHLVNNILEERSWHGRVWARELISPSPLANTFLANEAHKRTEIIKKIILQACGRDHEVDSTEATYALFTLMSPCMMLMIVNPELPTPIQALFSQPREKLVDYVTHLLKQTYQA